MNVCLTLFVVCGLFFGGCHATTCDACTSTWATGTTCEEIDAYLVCLLTGAASDAGCDTRIAKIANGQAARTTNGTCSAYSDSCACDLAIYKVDPSVGDSYCYALQTGLTCLGLASATTCDGSTSKATRVTAVTAMQTNMQCAGAPCLCQLAFLAVNQTSDVLKCAGHEVEKLCLTAATSGTACNSSATGATTLTTIKAQAQSVIGCGAEMVFGVSFIALVCVALFSMVARV